MPILSRILWIFAIVKASDVSLITTLAHETASVHATCLCDFDGYTLNCAGLGLSEVPQSCFEIYPSPTAVTLDQNSISRIEKEDFESIANSLINLSIQGNPLEFIHQHAFGTLSNVESLSINGSRLQFLQPNLLSGLKNLKYLSIDGPLSNLPRKLFSPTLANRIAVDLYSRELVALSCSVLSDLPLGSNVSSVAPFRWTSYDEVAYCSDVFPLPVLMSHCSLAGNTTPIIDCSTVMEEMTPATASLAALEVEQVFGIKSSSLLFPAFLESLTGKVPKIQNCLPSDIDKLWDFQLYYQHTEDLILETFYFEMSNLYLFTSSMTKSVTIKADTVVLSQTITPLTFPLNIYARQIVLSAPLYSLVNLNYLSPQGNPDFYKFRHERGVLNGVAVEYFKHGYINIALLKSSACLPPDTSKISNDFKTLVSATALELSLFCGNSLVDGDTQQKEAALEIALWVRNITKDEKDPEIFSINQLAHALEKRIKDSNSNVTSVNFVPYLTLPVYKPMIEALKENLNLFRSLQIQLQDKLERNAKRLFDMTLSFEERKGDLQFISDQSAQALEEAQNILANQIQKIDDLRLQTDGAYITILKLNDHFVYTYNHLGQSYNTLQTSIKKKKRNMFLRRSGAFFKGMFGLFVGTSGPGDVIDGVMGVGDYKRELAEAKEVLTDSMLKINEMMGDVEDIVDQLETITPPPPGQSHNWTAIFPDNAPLLAVVRQQIVSKYEWEIIDDNNNIVLDDHDMKKLRGCTEYRTDSGLMKTDGQHFSSNIISFSKLILDIRDEEENLKIANLAVTHGEERLEEVDNMLSETETNEENYREKMIQQNLVIMKLMNNLYQKTRKDMAFISKILYEFCQAYFYTFFIECSEELHPSPFDSFEKLIYKINQLQYDSLNSIGTLNPPPQPFSKNFIVSDQTTNCTVGDSKCPVTTLLEKGEVNIDLSEWWGPDLLNKDRVRVDKVRFYLRNSGEEFVIIQVTPPALFNDTYKGQVYSFVGHSSQCQIIYEDYIHADMSSAFYQTDCSSHQNYDQFYSRTTPFGSYGLSVAGDSLSNLTTSIEVKVEGAWIPRVSIDNLLEDQN